MAAEQEEKVDMVAGYEAVTKFFDDFVSFVKNDVHEDWVGKKTFDQLTNAFKYNSVMNFRDAAIDQIKQSGSPFAYLALIELELGVEWQELVENYPFAEVLASVFDAEVRKNLSAKNEKRKEGLQK